MKCKTCGEEIPDDEIGIGEIVVLDDTGEQIFECELCREDAWIDDEEFDDDDGVLYLN